MKKVWNKLHVDLGTTNPNKKKCGEFEILTYITDVKTSSSCSCTNTRLEGNKLKFCITNSGVSPTATKNYVQKRVNIQVRYKLDGVDQMDVLTAAVSIVNK